MDLKKKLDYLHELSKSTLGCRPSLLMLKAGYCMKIERNPPATDYRTPYSLNCEDCVDAAIQYIEDRQRKVTHNDIQGSNTRASHTIEKEISL